MAQTFLFVLLAVLVHFGTAAGGKPSFRQYRRINTRTHNGRQTPAPFNCVKSGFYADPKDCTRFYRCVDYFGTETKFTLFEFICAEGTIFDESLSVCNHPSWVNPTPPCWATTAGLNSTSGGSVTSSPPAASSSDSSVTTVAATSSSVAITESTSNGPTVAPIELTTVGEIPTQPSGVSETTVAAIVTESTSSSNSGPTQSGETSAPMITESSASPVMETTMLPAISSSVAPVTEDNLMTATAAPIVQPTESTTLLELSSTLGPSSPSSSEVPVSTTTTTPVPVTQSILAAITSASPIVQPPISAAPFTLTCNDDKYHRHPLRCDLYYKCTWTDLSFSLDLKSCSAGLHYDEDSGTCRTPGRTTACIFATLPPAVVSTTESLTTLSVTESSSTTTSTETPSTSAEPSTTSTETPSTSAETPSSSSEPLTTESTTTTSETSSISAEPSTTTTESPATTVTESTTTTTETPSISAEPSTTTTESPATTVTESTTTTTETPSISAEPSTTTTTESPATTETPSISAEPSTTTTESPATTVTETPSTSAEPSTTTTEIPPTSAGPTTAPPVDEPTTAPSIPTQYTLAPGSLYDCKRPGHYPYQLDCIRFYRCFEVQPTVLKGLLYRCPPEYAYSTVTERCVKQNTLPACDRNGIRLPMDYPVPIIKLEDTTMVQLEDFDSFFGNPNYFYNPRRKFKQYKFSTY